jgi:hypothetical protein
MSSALKTDCPRDLKGGCKWQICHLNHPSRGVKLTKDDDFCQQVVPKVDEVSKKPLPPPPRIVENPPPPTNVVEEKSSEPTKVDEVSKKPKPPPPTEKQRKEKHSTSTNVVEEKKSLSTEKKSKGLFCNNCRKYISCSYEEHNLTEEHNVSLQEVLKKPLNTNVESMIGGGFEPPRPHRVGTNNCKNFLTKLFGSPHIVDIEYKKFPKMEKDFNSFTDKQVEYLAFIFYMKVYPGTCVLEIIKPDSKGKYYNTAAAYSIFHSIVDNKDENRSLKEIREYSLDQCEINITKEEASAVEKFVNKHMGALDLQYFEDENDEDI